MENENLNDAGKPALSKGDVSSCCSFAMIPPDLEMAERMGSLWRAYACYICKKCGKVCEAKEQ